MSPSIHGTQAGQAFVLTLLLTVAAVLVGLSLLDTGILASEKMQLQNAADATAYSVSTVEARDLNFTAYTNRSMVANEVFLGQMVGLMSHADMIASIPSWWQVNFSRFYGVPVLGQILAGIGTGLRGLRFVKPPIRGFGSGLSSFVYEVNKRIDNAQRVFSLGSLLFTGATLFDIPGRNADGAHYSPFGYVSMGFHLLSHYADITPRQAFPNGGFVTSYRQDDDRRRPAPPIPSIRPGPFADKAGSASQKAGMARLAALVNATRDPYSLHRQCGPNPPGPWDGPCVDFTRNRPDGSTATGGVENFKFFLPIPAIDISTPPPLKINLHFDFGVNRHGGTDLRYKVARDGTQRYVWSAVDQMGMGFELSFDASVCIPNIITGGWICSPPAGPPPVRQSVPMAVGGAQSSIANNQFIGFAAADNTMFLDPFPPGGRVQKHSYGGGPGLLPEPWVLNNVFPWQLFPPLGDPGAAGPALAVQRNNLYRGYEGLSRYNDSKRASDPISFNKKDASVGWESPYFLVSLEKDLGEIAQSGAAGRFRLDPDTAADRLAVLAKSEVYFSRPNDLSYFRRADDRTELANGFNPYWDARLVDTSYLDRVSALALNQRQLWLPQDFTAVVTGLRDLLREIVK